MLNYFRSHWGTVRAGLVETIAKFRDDELDLRPYAGAWSVRELMLHIAQECAQALQRNAAVTLRKNVRAHV